MGKAIGELGVNYLCLPCLNTVLNTYNRNTVPATRRKKGIKIKLSSHLIPPQVKKIRKWEKNEIHLRHKSTQQSCKANPADHSIHLLQQHEYDQAFRELSIHSTRAKEARLKVATHIMLQEVSTTNEIFHFFRYFSS